MNSIKPVVNNTTCSKFEVALGVILAFAVPLFIIICIMMSGIVITGKDIRQLKNRVNS